MEEKATQAPTSLSDVAAKATEKATSEFYDVAMAYVTADNIRAALILTIGVRGAAWMVANVPIRRVQKYFDSKLGQQARKWMHHVLAMVFCFIPGVLPDGISFAYRLMIAFGSGFAVDGVYAIWNKFRKKKDEPA